ALGEAVDYLYACAEHHIRAETLAGAVVVVAERTVRHDHPAIAEIDIDEKPAIAVEGALGGSLHAEERLEDPELLAEAVLTANFARGVAVQHVVGTGANREKGGIVAANRCCGRCLRRRRRGLRRLSIRRAAPQQGSD